MIKQHFEDQERKRRLLFDLLKEKTNGGLCLYFPHESIDDEILNYGEEHEFIDPILISGKWFFLITDKYRFWPDD